MRACSVKKDDGVPFWITVLMECKLRSQPCLVEADILLQVLNFALGKDA